MSTSNWSNNWIMVFIYEIDKMSTGVWVLILWLMFIYFSLKKSVVISVQSSYFYDVWKRTKRWVSYRHLSSPAVTFGFNFYNENFLLFHTCTHTAGSGIDILCHLLIHLVLILMRNCFALAVTHGYLLL